jgi:hypothetical protein
MSDKTPAQKLLLKPGMSACVLHLPRSLDGKLGIPADTALTDDPASAEFVLEFASTQVEAENRLGALATALHAKTIAWIAYPKGSKAAGLDLNRDTIAAFVRTVDLIAVSAVSVDETWSALRVRPLKPGE